MNHLSLITSRWLYTFYMWVSVEDELQISDNESEKDLGNKTLYFWFCLPELLNCTCACQWGVNAEEIWDDCGFSQWILVKGLLSCSWCCQSCDVAKLHPVGFCILGNSTPTDTLNHKNSLEHLPGFAHFISLRLGVVILRSHSALQWAFFILPWIFFSSSELSSS